MDRDPARQLRPPWSQPGGAEGSGAAGPHLPTAAATAPSGASWSRVRGTSSTTASSTYPGDYHCFHSPY